MVTSGRLRVHDTDIITSIDVTELVIVETVPYICNVYVLALVLSYDNTDIFPVDVFIVKIEESQSMFD